VETTLRRAVAGDAAVLPELRSFLRQPEVVEVLGNLARRIEGTLIDRLSGTDLALREALTLKLEAMRQEIAGPDASPLERQLIERVVLSWLVVHEAEMRFANAGDMTSKQAEYWQRRIDACSRRYLAAVKMLATVRRLAIPVIVGQVNIARKQVNVANMAGKPIGLITASSAKT
jgi:hypothetical protein